LDLTSTQTPKINEETTQSTTATPSSPTTTETKTTTRTTTVTYWYEAETTVATCFAETWWIWNKRQFIGLQTAAEWLRLSIYFLTILDILVGTLCLLNSAYTLNKICEKHPDNRRQGD
jgi:hypothetical protein